MNTICGRKEIDNFIITANNDNKKIMLYFGAPWCGPCKHLKKELDIWPPIIQLNELCVGYIDIDDDHNSKIVNNYKISILPTQIFIKLVDNKIIEISRIEGYDFIKLEMEYAKL
jgi:thiol-disulfide isomerase/thioredoxin